MTDKKEESKKKQEEERLAQKKIIVDQYQQHFDEERFKDAYPVLYRELTADDRRIGLKIKQEGETTQLDDEDLKEILVEEAIEDVPELTREELERRKKDKDPLSSYDPDLIDFIRRAKKPEEAVEVIHFLSQRGEISKEQAERALHQLETKGLESFGTHKTPGYYFRYASEKRAERAMKKLKQKKEASDSESSPSH
ncbi:MAG: DUF2095 family protein [Candidatus Odinarchaeota archaeon]